MCGDRAAFIRLIVPHLFTIPRNHPTRLQPTPQPIKRRSYECNVKMRPSSMQLRVRRWKKILQRSLPRRKKHDGTRMPMPALRLPGGSLETVVDSPSMISVRVTVACTEIPPHNYAALFLTPTALRLHQVSSAERHLVVRRNCSRARIK